MGDIAQVVVDVVAVVVDVPMMDECSDKSIGGEPSYSRTGLRGTRPCGYALEDERTVFGLEDDGFLGVGVLQRRPLKAAIPRAVDECAS